MPIYFPSGILRAQKLRSPPKGSLFKAWSRSNIALRASSTATTARNSASLVCVEKPGLSKLFSLRPGVGQNIALCASCTATTARNSALLLCAEKPEVSKVLSLKPGVGQNIALYSSPTATTARNSAFQFLPRPKVILCG